ncbi:PAS domain S-box protein [Marinobacter sp. F3R08]|uniref:PAS domain S-box protein n=1 Tax=Marinobacter sp. F3R08 TaxID=2841559 RepID=UPI001C088783|nr:PAS domain S-box protein [Marinobacter sp. F3R08]MBU2955893.1 PAS domain S-box protein [Marinobacter sp. F3R08]
MSFRWKTILGIALIEVIFLSLLVWQASTYLQNTGAQALHKRANDTVQMASSVLLDSLIAFDLASLNEQVNELGTLSGVSYVRVRGYGRLLAQTGMPVSDSVSPDGSFDDVDDGIYDVQKAIEIDGEEFGTLEIGFSVRELRQIWSEAQRRLLLIALLELVLVGICSWLFGSYLSRRILALQKASRDLQEGKPVKALNSRGRDEVSQTIQSFNTMSSVLTQQKAELTATNQRLETANASLRQREAEFVALLEAAPDAIAMLSVDGDIVFVNQAFEHLFGCARSALNHTLLTDLLANHSPECREQSTLDRFTENDWQPITLESDTGNRFVDVRLRGFEAGEEGRSLVIIRDYTDEHNLIQAAKVSEHLKANLVDSSLDALITVDHEGLVTDFSRSAETLFGWRRSEVLGEPMHEFMIPPEFREAHAKGMAHFQATGEGPLIGKRVETTALRRTGDSIPVELALTAITVEGQVFVTAAIRDISERKQKEQELIESRAEAEQASTAKSRFLSYMSHEIRSPMNAVLGSLSLMSDDGSMSQAARRYLKLAQQSGESLLQVVNEVLDFSKIEAGQMEFHRVQFELNPLIDGVVNAVGLHRCKDTVTLTSTTDPALPAQLSADRDHLRQILTILLDNACKFTTEGEVTVRVGHQDPAGPGMEPTLVIEVSDTGPGIPAHLLSTVFSEFEQVDALRDTGFGGSGLGLAIARKLLDGMDGSLSVESEEGVGTTFTIRLPYEMPDPALRCCDPMDPGQDQPGAAAESSVLEAVTEVNPVNDQPTTDKGHLLLVDDVEANLLIGSEMLKARGYVVDLAHDGEEACQRAGDKNYAAILMDMRMPRMNGMEAALQIRQGNGPNTQTPIIALTANAEKTEVERCLKAGMNDFVSKPFNIEKLVGSIENCRFAAEASAMNSPEEEAQYELLSDAVLDQLVADTSAETLPMMISVFINEVKKRIQALENAEATGDEAEIREQAHALKSCAGTFGGERLQDSAQRLEELASMGRSIEDSATIQLVRKVAGDTLIAYSRYHEQLEKPPL